MIIIIYFLCSAVKYHQEYINVFSHKTMSTQYDIQSGES